MKTRVGEITFAVPQVREGGFYPQALEKGLRSERALTLALVEMYVQGVSTRKVKAITEQLCGVNISSSAVSEAARQLDTELSKWWERPMVEYPFLFLDAYYEQVREDGQVWNLASLIAVGVKRTGKREILGVSVSLSEHDIHWRTFLKGLKQRGLGGIQLITSDDHAGLRAARVAVLGGIPWLRCQFHLQHNAQAYVPHKEIMQFATLLYRLRLTDEQDEDILTPDILNMPNGAFPELLPLTSPQDEVVRVANEVHDLVTKGLPKKSILLLHTDGNGVQHLKQAIEDRLGKGSAIDPKDTFPGDYVRVTTFNAGAGLESQIVFLVGLKSLFEEEQSLRLADDEREALIRDNTRKLYMAATRAGQRLVLTYSGELPEVLRNIFGSQVV